MNEFETQRLKILNELGQRKFVIPSEVKGFFHQKRQFFQLILLSIFLFGPWIKVNDQQLLWLDIDKKVFHIFGLSLGAHEAPLIFLLIITATLSLAVVTSLFGRVWCGWSCPQTVFIEMIYRRIEKWVEGNSWARRRLRDQEINIKKIVIKTVKWILYFLVSALIAHSFAAYFVGTDPLLKMMQNKPSQNPSYFLMIFGMASLLTINFGWFREQFCLIACPYGRIQSLLMDSNSVTVTYDQSRGEPRRGVARGGQKQGDCVSCLNCISACPTGIDIRNGLQMECIACTACMDACDEVMKKVGKKPGLIRYANQTGQGLNLLRPRTLVYLIGVFTAISVAAWNISYRDSLDIVLLRAKESPYQIIPDASGRKKVLNHVRLKLKNQHQLSQNISLNWPEGATEVVINQPQFELKPFESKEVHIFLQFGNEDSFEPLQLILQYGKKLEFSKTVQIDKIGPD